MLSFRGEVQKCVESKVPLFFQIRTNVIRKSCLELEEGAKYEVTYNYLKK